MHLRVQALGSGLSTSPWAETMQERAERRDLIPTRGRRAVGWRTASIVSEGWLSNQHIDLQIFFGHQGAEESPWAYRQCFGTPQTSDKLYFNSPIPQNRAWCPRGGDSHISQGLQRGWEGQKRLRSWSCWGTGCKPSTYTARDRRGRIRCLPQVWATPSVPIRRPRR